MFGRTKNDEHPRLCGRVNEAVKSDVGADLLMCIFEQGHSGGCRYVPVHVPSSRTSKMGRSFEELRSSGMLWLINRVVFHPRGLALSLHVDKGVAVGWSLQGDGSEVWSFNGEQDGDGFSKACATLANTTAPMRACVR